MLTPLFTSGWVSVLLAHLAYAHIAPFHKAMYCLNGTVPGSVDPNNALPTHPLYQMTPDEYWIHAFDNCSKFPPEPGVFLDLEAGGNFTLELADNRASTSLSLNPRFKLTDWGDGKEHPNDYSLANLGGLGPTPSGCIPSPNLHTQNESMAAGTAVAIAYVSDINKVTPENLAVFTVAYHTPFRRVATYHVPSGMPPCPPGGCVCVWSWIPKGCGQRNMYLFPLQCNVTVDSTPPKTIAPPKPAVWCEDDPAACTKGSKQVFVWQQQTGNNIEVTGKDVSGAPKSPAYNAKCGFSDGAQTDIFVEDGCAQAATGSQRMKRHRGRKHGH